VFVTAAFVKEVFSSAVAMIIYTGLSMISLLLVCLFPTPMMVTGFAFIIGFAAAGGVLQMGATIMAMSFPNGKGKATGIFYTAGSIASFTIPLITAKLSQISIASIMWFDFLIADRRLCDRPVHRLSSTAGSRGAKTSRTAAPPEVQREE
jgi:MFS family permease